MEEKKKMKFRFPLWAKTLTVLVLSVFTISLVAVLYSSSKIRSITREHYINKSVEVARSLSLFLDVEDVVELKKEVNDIYVTIPEDELVSNEEWGEPNWEAYLDRYSSILTPGGVYDRVMEQIVKFHSVNDALYTYVCYPDFVNNRLIYLCDDAEEEDRCLPGSFDPFTKQDLTVEADKEGGFKPEITNLPQYGYLASTGQPIHDENNEIVAYAFVDLSMDAIVAEENLSARNLTLILLGMGGAVVLVGYLLVLLLIVRPVRILTHTANEYTKSSGDGLDKFKKINIRTKDEIEDLANSMKKMEADINHYISDLLSTTTKLEGAERKADELKYIADRDALTGLNNKRAYFEKEEMLNIEIKQGKAKFAICMIDLNDLKLTNDTLGHEKGDILIVAISNIIKKVFALSYVYRVGGDEFVIISENEDYKNINKLKNLFLTIVEQSSEDVIKLSAAIGVAFYNPKEDNNVEDVFKRADSEMYKMKKAMKAKQKE